ncbi:putative glycosyltransferase, DXD sugar-binding, alpha 1,4-glycosyltransferase [Helianthus annuus]|nr:putative glycosyltransferase, DXD sugar-binding, alpha 1,4-glycosyltransferase [Helianthus annuus]KAJ0641454.1 putative glycosyltransferase, DXD sugar-binding, alpha 1,4-glycosyltransferase [Helianthus annuus]KAJ0821838.1 putative glycosyltransferase, DXD sugar-binding, alpha 1,4-glycosyltransferase [Helianthus annuus]
MTHNPPNLTTLTTTNKRSLFVLLSLLFLFLLSFNGASIFSVKIPSLAVNSPAKPSRNLISVQEDTTSDDVVSSPPPPTPTTTTAAAASATAGDSTNFVNPNYPNPNTFLPLLRKSHSFEIESENLSANRDKKLLKLLIGYSGRRRNNFPARVKQFFTKNNETTSSCHIRFFMTWISSLTSFNERAFHSIESIFKSHPNGCLLIASNSLDSIKGRQILQPFVEKGFRVTAIAPDFNFLCKKTMAETWFTRLVRGHIRTGIIPLGQNISNLLRLCLLYKYGGVYVDFDVVILKSFSELKNSIGAQSVDQGSKNWSRLNNAVMVFDKMHPLVYKFIEEFALTFNGNKWGHNGPYLVSRVVSRVQGRPGYNFTVMPPMAFYPMNWDRVRVLFRGAKNESDARWLKVKYEQIRNQSYALHLWNKESRGLEIEEGSIVRKILLDHCVFCNISSTDYNLTTSD